MAAPDLAAYSAADDAFAAQMQAQHAQEAQKGNEQPAWYERFTAPIEHATTTAIDSAVSAADSLYNTQPMRKARDVVSGGMTGAVNMADAAHSFARAVVHNFGDPQATGDLAEVGDPAARAREHAMDADPNNAPSSPIWDHAKNAILDFRDAVSVSDPTLTDNLTQGVAQLAIPFAGYSRALAGLHGVADVVASGAMTDTTALDPHAMRTADLIRLGQHTEGKLGEVLRAMGPYGLNAYISYLTDRGDETEAEGRWKNALDGLTANLIATPLLHAAGVVLKQGTAGLRYAAENGIGSSGDIVGIKSPASQRGAVGDLRQAERRTATEQVPEDRRVAVRGNRAELAPDDEARFQKLMEQPGMRAKFQQLLNNNGSEPGAVGAGSQEAVNRVAAEKEAGTTRWRIDPDGNRTPLTGVDAVDTAAPKGSIHTARDAEGNEIITDRGGLPAPQAHGLLARAQAQGMSSQGPSDTVRARYGDWLGGVVKRQAMEARGQEILDDLVEKGRTSNDVAQEFWKKTYFQLPATAQARFRVMLEDHAGFAKGTMPSVEAGIERLDLPDNPEHLEGTDRGLVALMDEANRRYEHTKVEKH